jgi:hypothetical protein
MVVANHCFSDARGWGVTGYGGCGCPDAAIAAAENSAGKGCCYNRATGAPVVRNTTHLSFTLFQNDASGSIRRPGIQKRLCPGIQQLLRSHNRNAQFIAGCQVVDVGVWVGVDEL